MVLTDRFIAARKASTPLIAIRTPDPASTIKIIKDSCENDVPIAQWDSIQGMISMNGLAAPAVDTINEKKPAAIVTGNPVTCLERAMKLPPRSVLFFHNAHLFVQGEGGGDSTYKLVIQAMWNLRDTFKKNNQSLVMLVPGITLPPEISNDVMVMDEPLPTDVDLQKMVIRTFGKYGVAKPSKAMIPKIIDALLGLAMFPAEQIVSMALANKQKKRIELNSLWDQKITAIEATSGLRVHRGGPRFSDIGGNHNIKNFLTKIIGGKRCPSLVVFLDEIEKAMAAAGTDTSGTTTDQLKVLLTDMQNNDWTGLILYGFAGTAKSELAKAFGNEAGCVTAEADLGAMKDKWVGSSEGRMRAFMKVIKAMGGKNVFFIATCNQVDLLRPELKRRFKKGTFFCDLPNQQEKNQIWKIYFKKFGIPESMEKPEDEGWTGDEIRTCCTNAHEMGISLMESAKYLTIVSKAMGPKKVEEMRVQASGKYVSALHPGPYVYQKNIPEGAPK